jgi:hypothetical protein
MTVNLSEEDAQLFIKNGFSREQVGETVNHYRSQGLSDEDIQSKLNARVAGWKAPQQPVQPRETSQQTITQEKPVTPDMSSGTPTLYGNAEYVPTYEELDQNYKAGKLSKEELITQAQRRKDLDFKEADNIVNKQSLNNVIGSSLIGAGAIPLFNMPVTGFIGGALTGAGLGIINQKSAKDTLKDAGIGAATGLALGKLPVVGRALAKTKIGQTAIKKGEQVAENVIGKLSESELGSNILLGAEKLGNILTKERHILPQQKPSQPLPKGLNLNDVKKNIRANQFDKRNLQTVKGVNRRGIVWSKVLQNEDNGVIQSERQFNDIINEMSKNPEKLRNSNYVQDLENRIQKVINDSPYPNETEFAESFWDKYAKALDEGMRYNELKNGTTRSNTFGGKIEQPAEPLPIETKQSQLPQSMKEAGTLPDEFKSLNPEYEVLHNTDLANQATEAINKDPNKVLGDLQQKVFNKDSELSALDFETARQTLQKLYAEGRTEEALALTEQISQKASKAGQSVQALSLWSKTTPEGAVRYAQKIISDYNKTAKNKLPLLSEQQANEIMELAKNTQLSEIGTRENSIANQLLLKYFKELVPASAGSKLRTLQNISLLLNPKTFLRNISGNSIFAAMDTGVSKPIAAGIDTIASKFTGNKTRVLPQIKEYAQGLGQGFREGAEDVSLGINTRDKLGSRFNLNDRTSFDNIPGLNQLEKALNYSLQVPDRMFYQAAYNESIANQLKASGLTKPTEEMVKNATNEALESVFQNNSALGNMVLKMRQSGNELLNLNGFGLGDAFIPYAQTPANVAQQGINYSPLGIAKGINNLRLGNQRQGTMDIARGLTGTGLMGLGAYGAANGLINPNIDDYQVRKNYEAMGIRPNTLNIGDYNVSHNQLQPLAAPIAGGAALTDIANGNVMGAVDRSIDSIADLGMLQSLNKFMADREDYGTGTAATNLIASIPSRFIPTGLKQITDLTDNTQRDTYDKNPLRQGLNQAIAKVPGLNKTLPVKYDVLGQPIQKYKTEGVQRVLDATVNPVFVNRKNNDPTMNKLIDLYEAEGDKSVLMPLADKTVRFKDLKGNQVVRPLNAKERNQYQQQLGVINKQLLDNIVNSEFYNSLDNENKIDLINTTKRQVKGFVDEELWGKPNAQKRALIRKLTRKEEDKVMREILKTYKNNVLPIKTKQIYEQNFK